MEDFTESVEETTRIEISNESILEHSWIPIVV
ncbi:hypothetical protein EDD63_101138 [Breznakia blatticola]|uniref:Uncharacterized protein n=1 Tax=Breznakia blatticola TaxID=1754012 RepID=A0A4R8AD14_9FIRM|nr:hypothetical protein EDD63_101138 [Breznakia blatticola]